MMISRRAFSTARRVAAQPATVQTVPQRESPAVVVTPPPQPAPTVVHQSPTVPTVRVKRSVGGFRGGITGFLLGLAVSGALGYSYLLQEYQNASNVLLSSVEELQSSTGTITSYIKRIEDVENQLRRVQKGGVTQDDHASLRKEMHKVYSGLNVENLDLKSKIAELENALAKSARPNEKRVV